MFMPRITRLAAVVCCLSGVAMGQSDADKVKFFETKIRPVLIKHCYACHSNKAGRSHGSLLLDTRHGIQAGGDRGPAVVPTKPTKSWLLKALTHEDPDLAMPPEKPKLSKKIIADFRIWIEQGAVDPRTTATKNIKSTINYEEARERWAFQPPKPWPMPKVKATNWPVQKLDYFVLHKLEQNGLKPGEDAAQGVLLRRLYFDVIGLPPTIKQLAAFKARANKDGFEIAWKSEVDQLLRSPRFGERWGRHWLDVARYAESSGKDSNFLFPHAWRYRNYVIDAFNEDKPFDRFLTEQIAGDLLPAENKAVRARLMIATGFLAIGPKGLNEMNQLQFDADLIDEQIDSIGRAVMGMSIGCARCHDHKFDPFSMTDYYALAGIFASTKTFYGTAVMPNNQRGGDLMHLPALQDQIIPNRSIPPKRLKKLKDELVALDKEEKRRKAAARKAVENGEDPSKHFGIADALRILWRRGAIHGDLKTVDKEGKALPLAMGVADKKRIIDAAFLERGELAKAGAPVPRAFPKVFGAAGLPAIPKKTSGRLQFAQMLTAKQNPLTSRVMSNRIWKHLMGQGIVPTMDNFGANGVEPSHPKLLDHLALRFQELGWSVKSMVREIVTSRTYWQSSTYRAAAFAKDPDNRYLWRANKRRLDAESIRDSMLFVAGQLRMERPQASFVAALGNRPISIIEFNKGFPKDVDGLPFRSVYLPVLRDSLPDSLALFDFAEPSLVTGSRDTTNVPIQALYLMNSPFILKLSERMATDLANLKTSERITTAYQRCFARKPSKQELKLGNAYLSSGTPGHERLARYCQTLLITAEFRNLD